MIHKKWVLLATQARAFLWEARYHILRMIWNYIIYPVYWNMFSVIEKVTGGNPNRQVDFPITPFEKEYPNLIDSIIEDRYDGINRTAR